MSDKSELSFRKIIRIRWGTGLEIGKIHSKVIQLKIDVFLFQGVGTEGKNLKDSRAVVCGVRIGAWTGDIHVCAIGCRILVWQSIIEGTQWGHKFWRKETVIILFCE